MLAENPAAPRKIRADSAAHSGEKVRLSLLVGGRIDLARLNGERPCGARRCSRGGGAGRA